jgi:hypothetical protein
MTAVRYADLAIWSVDVFSNAANRPRQDGKILLGKNE